MGFGESLYTLERASAYKNSQVATSCIDHCERRMSQRIKKLDIAFRKPIRSQEIAIRSHQVLAPRVFSLFVASCRLLAGLSTK